MVGVVVVTHCHLAEELICAAQLVVLEHLEGLIGLIEGEGDRGSSDRDFGG
jgi:mannose/fructose-specific phosphotransferase system component IIA